MRGLEQASCLALLSSGISLSSDIELSSDIQLSSDIGSDMEVDVNDTVDVVSMPIQTATVSGPIYVSASITLDFFFQQHEKEPNISAFYIERANP